MAKLEETDAVSVREYFVDLEDPRSCINRRHSLEDIIVICILGVVAGADGPKAIATWATAQKEWLCKHLELPHGIPSHDTIGRLLALLRPEAFQKCFQQWLASLRHGSATEGTKPEIVAIDGKTMRHSHDRRRCLGPLHMVSAWAVRGGISLGQLATAEKSNEIMAIPELLGKIDIRNTVVTIDAQGCQRAIARDIIRGGGDYVLALKGNQAKLFEAVQDYFKEITPRHLAPQAPFSQGKRCHETSNGRLEYRLPRASHWPEWYLEAITKPGRSFQAPLNEILFPQFCSGVLVCVSPGTHPTPSAVALLSGPGPCGQERVLRE